MANSDVQICSNALRIIGADSITALTDDNDRARLMNGLYLPTLEEKIQSHTWNFAQRRVALARLTDTPAYDFTYMFQLPQDPRCLQVLETNLNEDDKWRIETYATTTATYRVLLTDVSTISILYLALITDATLYSPLFSRAMEYELAYLASYPLTRNAAMRDLLFKDKELAWQKARSRDGQESRALKKLLSSSFTSVR